jgi:lysyl-tRNA synthetase class 2
MTEPRDDARNENLSTEREWNKLVLQRIEKIEAVRAAGKNPWPNDFKPDADTAKVATDNDALSAEELDALSKSDAPRRYKLGGRLMANNFFGKAAFLRLQDRAGRLQVFVRKDGVGDEAFAAYKTFDIGDLIAVEGVPFRTRTGELTLNATSIRLLAKAIRPLPEKWHGLKDKEQRFRQRYVDLIVNPDVRDIFLKRNRIIKGVRDYLDGHGYLEVETPMMHPIPGGASARPFVTHHNALDMQLYLRIAPELYLKRLIVGGLERVYEINRNFRNEGIDRNHNPEFTMIELYQAYATYEDMIELTEELISDLVVKITGGTTVVWNGITIDFARPWKRVAMEDAVVEIGGFPRDKLHNHDALRALLVQHDEPARPGATWGELLAGAFEVLCEGKLVNPTFVTRFPVDISPLARRNDVDPTVVDRFELIVAGMEVANAFSELNDPIDQAERFRGQLAAGHEEFQDEQRIDLDFVRALEFGMPPTAGEGIGIDRLVMLLTGGDSIKEVILFPHLRPEAGRLLDETADDATEAPADAPEKPQA